MDEKFLEELIKKQEERSKEYFDLGHYPLGSDLVVYAQLLQAKALLQLADTLCDVLKRS